MTGTVATARRRKPAEGDAADAPAPRAADFLSDLFEEIHCDSLAFLDVAYAAPWSVERRAGPEARGYFIQAGAADLTVVGGPELALETGDLLFLPPGRAHRLSSRGAAPAIIGHAVYRLDRTRARALLRILPPVVLLKNEGGEMSSVVRPMADLIVSLRDSTEMGDPAILRRIAEATVMTAIQHHLKVELALNPQTVKLGVFRIAPALQAIHRDPAANWTLSTLAREAGMSRTVFAEAFAEAMGEAPGHYLTAIRMARAEDLLQSSALPLTEVAARVGYGVEAFGRAFKRHAGVTPGRFRAAHIRTDGPWLRTLETGRAGDDSR